MEPNQDPVVNPTETTDPTTQGTTVTPPVGSQGSSEPENIVEGTPPPAISADEVAQLKKERDQAIMERNNLRNKTEEDRKKALEESAEYKTLYEEEAEKRKALEDQSEQDRIDKEATKLRDQFIDNYEGPEQVKEYARKLIEKNKQNLQWGDVTDVKDAEKSIHDQMDVFKELFPASNDEGDESIPTVNANNPGTGQGSSNDALAGMSAAEMRKTLPIAPAR